MDWLWHDLRFALRNVRKDYGFLIACVTALALGIGSTTAMFSVVDNVMLHPFPYIDGAHIYGFEIRDRNSKAEYGRNFFTVPEFLDYQRQNRIFRDTMGVWETTTLMGSGDHLEPLDTDTVTDNSFRFLGVEPLLGRGILPGDGRPGAPAVFVLSYKVWVSRFGSDPTIVGRKFILNDKPATLIGIMPRRFAFWGGDIWTPAIVDPAEAGADRSTFVMYGHLRPGVTEKAAQARLFAMAKRFAKIYPGSYPADFTVRMQLLGGPSIQGTVGHAMLTLLGAVGLLLLIACANVANLLLARATAHQKELALRMTLGAGRWRLVRQLMVESMLLSFAGAGAGCLFAAVALQGLLAILPIYTFPDEAVIAINREVLLATVAAAILTAFLFGLAPALAAARGDLNESLRAGARGNTGFRGGRMRHLLIAGEVTLSMLLLTGSGLLMRSFILERQIDLGIRPSHLLVTTLSLPPARYRTTDAQARFVRELLPRVEALRGVLSAAAALDNPPYGGNPSDFDVPGTTHAERWKGSLVPCSREFFTTIGVRLLAGRFPTADDENGKHKVAVINQTLARRFFGQQDPLGRPLTIGALRTAPDPLADPRFVVIGVVSDMKNQGLREDSAAEAFIPYSVAGFGQDTLFVHTAGDPAALNRSLTSAILRLDRTVIPQQMVTMDYILEVGQYARPRFGLVLFSVFAAIGLVLVTIGVYSVVSWTVTQQQHEIGIRMALGASAANVRAMVLAGTLRVVLAGVAAGLVLAWVVARVMASQLWGVSGYDPVTLCGVVAVLIAVGLLAACVPSLRATRVDPAVSLRCE